MKVWTWLCWTVIFASTCICTSKAEDGTNDNSLGYPTLNFTINVKDKEGYTRFLQSVRDQLTSGNQIHGISVLPDISTLPVSQRFLLLKLSSSATTPITLALDVATAGVVAYGFQNQSYFFNDKLAFSNLFNDTKQNTLPFGSSYGELENSTGMPRSKIDLGLLPLNEAVSNIVANNIKTEDLASCLIVVMQMVSEAARFRYIEHQVRWSTEKGQRFRPDGTIYSLENNWEALSTAVQESRGGVFSEPVQLQRLNVKFNLDSVTRELVANLGLMLFISCKDNSTSSGGGGCATDFEPTVRILGRNGLCLDVSDEIYSDGNKIHMWPCKSKPAANQLWTLKRDGTLQSNGKCLTANGSNPAGNNVVIYDCQTAMHNATQWAIWDNGTIINPQFGLVLTVNSGDKGALLTLEKNIYASSQGFLATNNTQPFRSPILGQNDLCLQTNGTKVWVVECVSNRTEQKWALYADGSIRPQQNKDDCLTCNKLDAKGTIFTIDSCSLASSGQRWAFRDDGIIFNLQNGMVMDVKKIDPSLEEVIIWPFNGGRNQRWLPLL
ncbi:hypothetical protein JCGZ_10885 [Jatropha curcas]|uniref:Ribosome-inactivating protein n=2 Tax=Jatropha curcas TaxID=180498 RepID=I3V672_JATCU|nr:ricin-like precursor [Jatropha curcas]AFK73425.1 type 2 ribosomal inactivating protein [Jatropha curcas]KDP34680.1 hypothetical protein JCGZ_10885 [Jatropha curcas]